MRWWDGQVTFRLGGENGSPGLGFGSPFGSPKIEEFAL